MIRFLASLLAEVSHDKAKMRERIETLSFLSEEGDESKEEVKK